MRLTISRVCALRTAHFHLCPPTLSAHCRDATVCGFGVDNSEWIGWDTDRRGVVFFDGRLQAPPLFVASPGVASRLFLVNDSPLRLPCTTSVPPLQTGALKCRSPCLAAATLKLLLCWGMGTALTRHESGDCKSAMGRRCRLGVGASASSWMRHLDYCLRTFVPTRRWYGTGTGTDRGCR
jgi:hypothetical protein